MSATFLTTLGSSRDERNAKLSPALALLRDTLQSGPGNVGRGRAAEIIAAHEYLTLCVEVYLRELGRSFLGNRQEVLSDLKAAVEALGITKTTKESQGRLWKNITALRAIASSSAE